MIADAPRALDASSEWDGIAYLVFPRRAGYLKLQESADYQAAIPDRVAGTYERMLYVLIKAIGTLPSRSVREEEVG